MALRVYQAVSDVSHPHQNTTKMPIRYAAFLPFSVILDFKQNAGLIVNMSHRSQRRRGHNETRYSWEILGRNGLNG